MTTSATFETAALASAISKAAAIAPANGHAFDKAAGIVLEVDTVEDIVAVKATDTEAYFMEWVAPLETHGGSAVWRLPSKPLAGVIGSLPIGQGRTTTLKQDKNTLFIISGRTKAKFQLITNERYPEWEPFEDDGMATVNAFGALLKRVSWAASTANDPPFTGVFMDGEIMAATDKYKIATVPAVFECERPISVPPMAVAAVLKDQGDVKIKITDTQLLIMPDAHTQLRATVCGIDYPNVKRLFKRDYPELVRVSRDELVECINRSKHVIGSDRSPLLKVWFGEEEIAVAVIQETDGLIDIVDVPGFATHKKYQIGFSHQNIVSALMSAPEDMVEIGYDPSNKKVNLYIAGGCGYEAWVATRRTTGAVNE